MMQEKGDEPVVKLAKDFIENYLKRNRRKAPMNRKRNSPTTCGLCNMMSMLKHEQAIGSLEEKSTWK